MRMCALILVFAVLPFASLGQQPAITHFDPTDETGAKTLSWVTSASNRVYGLEWTPDLNYQWLRVSSHEVFVNGAGTALTGGLDILSLTNLTYSVHGMAIPIGATHFFRIVSPPSDTFCTNSIRLVNLGTIPVSNVTMGTKADFYIYNEATTFSQLLAGESTPYVELQYPFPVTVVDFPLDFPPVIASSQNAYWSLGWYLTYDLNGAPKKIEMPFLLLGPPEKRISILLSDQSTTVLFEWFNAAFTSRVERLGTANTVRRCRAARERQRWRQKMKLIEPVTDEHGQQRSFYTYIIPFGRLCRCIASCPGVEFTERPRFFWWGEDVSAQFRFKGHDFKIETIWADTHVCPKDDVSAYPEIVEIEQYVERNGRSMLSNWIKRMLGNKERTEAPTTGGTVRR